MEEKVSRQEDERVVRARSALGNAVQRGVEEEVAYARRDLSAENIRALAVKHMSRTSLPLTDAQKAAIIRALWSPLDWDCSRCGAAVGKPCTIEKLNGGDHHATRLDKYSRHVNTMRKLGVYTS